MKAENKTSSRKKSDKRKLTYAKSYYQAWPKNAGAVLFDAVERYAKRYKYVCFGVTTDTKTQYDQHFRYDQIAWQKMTVRLRTDSARTIRQFIEQSSANEHYINNNIHFPETLFDERKTYYAYVLLGRRKKGKNITSRKQYSFIELFSGLGGFNTALTRLGCTCVFASEKKNDLRELYLENHKVKGRIVGDISTCGLTKIPRHDILCAGSPCSFDAIYDVIKAQKDDKPKYLIFEADVNLKADDSGHTWNVIQENLIALGYDVKTEILSPHQFGLPQHRQRLYIVGIRHDIAQLTRFAFPVPDNNGSYDIHSIINENETDFQPLTLKMHRALKAWQVFLDMCREHKVAIPKFPIWATEFGETYPYATLPRWKKYIIKHNREFYEQNKSWLGEWKASVSAFDKTHLKMEWNVGDETCYELKDNIVQFLASGIRVKAPTFSPSLFGTLMPIIPWVKLPADCIPPFTAEDLSEFGLTADDVQYGRYLTIHETARLQGLESLDFGTLPTSRLYEALGSSVNARVVEEIAERLLV